MGALRLFTVLLVVLLLALTGAVALARQESPRREWLRLLTESPTGYDYYLLNVETGERTHLASLNELQLNAQRYSGRGPNSFTGGQPYGYGMGGSSNMVRSYGGSGWRQRRLASLIGQYETMTLPGGRSLLVRQDVSAPTRLYEVGLERAFTNSNGLRSLLSTQSPDGEWLYFTEGIDWYHELFRIRPDGSGLQAMFPTATRFRNFTWTPDGQWLVYTAGPRGSMDIYRSRADGSDLENLTHAPGNDRFSAWTPDGQWMIFQTEREGYQQIYAMRPDGSQTHRIGSGSEISDWFEGWTPDGKWMLVSSGDYYYSNALYKMRPDGSDRQILSDTGEVHDFVFVWEIGDAQILYYGGQYSGSTDVYRMAPDGTGAENLTNTAWRNDWIIGWVIAPTLGWRGPVIGMLSLGLLSLVVQHHRRRADGPEFE